MKRYVIFILLVSFICVGLLAKGSSEYEDSSVCSTTGFDWQEVGALQVGPTEEIVSIFEENGVDGKYLAKDRENQFIPSDMRDDIVTVIDDDEDDIVALIKKHVKSFLVEDKIENVYMILGTKKFCATLEDDSYQFAYTGINWCDLGDLQVGPTKEIVSIFEDNGVDGKYFAMDRESQFITSDIRDDIVAVIDDDKDDVVTLIKEHMKSFLVEDKTEYVYMILGTKKFCAALDDDSYKFASTKIAWQSLGMVQVGPCAEIISIFEENGVDGKYLSMNREDPFVPLDVRDDIEEIITDDEDDVIALIKEDMRTYLVEDDVEYVYMLLGTKMFSVALNQ